ncbi:hypothetical protein [Nocardia sp. NPDC050710]|uniref:MarR family winged helix-turn-helix transcriptional regulator n=1 Tax=Nocardia sp. NPDC050710 TaxID=3157220 RepID=UPI0033ED11E5
MAEQHRIGYWLAELDRLINLRFDEDLAAGELGRRHWQLLHSLDGGPAPADRVREGLAPFWKDAAEFGIQLGQLVDRGLVAEDAGTLTLTEAGRATHDAAFARIGRRRRAMVEGITDERYAETMRVLARMAENMAGSEVPPARDVNGCAGCADVGVTVPAWHDCGPSLTSSLTHRFVSSREVRTCSRSPQLRDSVQSRSIRSGRLESLWEEP